VNYDSEGSEVVREFIIHNALYWIEEFNLDGLRLDAVHAIKDDSPKHVLDELAERVRAAAFPRPVHLLLENENNQAFRLSRDERGEPTSFTAQWNDDMHHVLHTAATLESNGYYGDYKDDTEKLGRALAEGFAFQGEVMHARNASRGGAVCSSAAGRVRRLYAEPRPDRESSLRGAHKCHCVTGGCPRHRSDLSSSSSDADALHGRGVGEFAALPIFFAISRESWVILFGGVVGRRSLPISLN
jgi:hypothetical protein